MDRHCDLHPVPFKEGLVPYLCAVLAADSLPLRPFPGLVTSPGYRQCPRPRSTRKGLAVSACPKVTVLGCFPARAPRGAPEARLDDTHLASLPALSQVWFPKALPKERPCSPNSLLPTESRVHPAADVLGVSLCLCHPHWSRICRDAHAQSPPCAHRPQNDDTRAGCLGKNYEISFVQ